VGCSFGKQTTDEPDSSGNDKVITLPIESEVVNDASGKEHPEQNQEDEETFEEGATPILSPVPVTSLPQQAPTATPYVEQPTPTPQAEQSTPAPVVTEEPPVADAPPPADDYSNDMGEF